MNIYQRVNKVRQEVTYVQKDQRVQNYMAVTHDAVTAQVRDSMAKHGIVAVQDFEKGFFLSPRKTGEGDKAKTVYRWQANYEIAFVNVDEPDDRITMHVVAHADDYGDKAAGKAMSYAMKYAMLKLFSLETGESDESRVEGDRQSARLFEMALEQVQELVEHDDALGVYLMYKKVGHEGWKDIYNAAPEGKKGAWKEQLVNAEKTGLEVLKAINTAIKTEDDLQLQENLADVTAEGKRLLQQYLHPDALADMLRILKVTKDNEKK